jgi:hypothetical protein
MTAQSFAAESWTSRKRMPQLSPSIQNRLGYKHLTVANSSGDAAYKFTSGKDLGRIPSFQD